MLSKFAGLPAHPLFVHIPVVLLPMVAVGAVAMAFSGWVRDRLGWIVLGVGLVAGASTQLAVESGQALQDSVKQSTALDQHIAMGESIRPLSLLLFLVALAVMLVDRRQRHAWPFAQTGPNPNPPKTTPGNAPPLAGWIRVGLVALTIVAAVATTVRVYQIGHTGAQATWENTRVVSRSDDG